MKKRRNNRRMRGRMLVATLLMAVGGWVFSLTGALDGLFVGQGALGENPAVTVGAFPVAMKGEVYGLLPASGLLSSGREAVEARLGQQSAQLPLLPTLPFVPPTVPPVIDEEGEQGPQMPDLPTTPVENVQNFLAKGSEGGNYIWADPIYVKNSAEKELDGADISAMLAGNQTLPEGGKILVVHTHGTEAYTPNGTDTYIESDPYRTTDCTQNVVQVGEEMARIFRQAGFQVLHDTNLYDYPDYNSSYTNSRRAVEGWLEQYPDICLILDVHRDAIAGQDGTPYRLVTEGEDAAQVMLVVGSDETLAHPNWTENFSLALQIQQEFTARYGELCRPTMLASNRYNQDLSTAFLLVEVGGHGNTLQDALEGARRFAECAVASLTAQEDG